MRVEANPRRNTSTQRGPGRPAENCRHLHGRGRGAGKRQASPSESPKRESGEGNDLDFLKPLGNDVADQFAATLTDIHNLYGDPTKVTGDAAVKAGESIATLMGVVSGGSNPALASCETQGEVVKANAELEEHCAKLESENKSLADALAERDQQLLAANEAMATMNQTTQKLHEKISHSNLNSHEGSVADRTEGDAAASAQLKTQLEDAQQQLQVAITERDQAIQAANSQQADLQAQQHSAAAAAADEELVRQLQSVEQEKKHLEEQVEELLEVAGEHEQLMTDLDASKAEAAQTEASLTEATQALTALQTEKEAVDSQLNEVRNTSPSAPKRSASSRLPSRPHNLSCETCRPRQRTTSTPSRSSIPHSSPPKTPSTTSLHARSLRHLARATEEKLAAETKLQQSDSNLQQANL